MPEDTFETYAGWPVRPGPEGRWLDVRMLGPVEPLPFGPRMPAAPAPLIAPLFGPVEPSEAERAAWGDDPIPEARTYAIMDAAALPMLADRLAGAGLESACLFSGQAAEEMGDAAPWIVTLEPGNPLVNELMGKGRRNAGLWDRRPGLVIRSRRPMAAVRAHFRKFTRIEDSAGEWYFNRFWAASVSTTLLTLGNEGWLTPFVGPFFPTGRDTLRLIVLSPFENAVLSRIEGTEPPPARVTLTREVRAWMHHIRRVQQFEELIDIAIRHARSEVDLDEADARDHLRGCRAKFFSIGFWRRDHLVSLCVWELMLGPDFIHAYAGGHIRELIRTAPGDWQAIKAIRHFLEPPPPEPTEAEIAAMQAAARTLDDI